MRIQTITARPRALIRFLLIQESRQLSKNLTFQYKNTIYQIQTEKRRSTLCEKQKSLYKRKRMVQLKFFTVISHCLLQLYSSQEKQGEVADA